MELYKEISYAKDPYHLVLLSGFELSSQPVHLEALNEALQIDTPQQQQSAQQQPQVIFQLKVLF